MAEIIVSGIEKSFEQDRMVLDGVSFQVDAGERVGLLGGNGAGKTTLLRIMTGELSADKGSITIPQGRRIGYISQLAEVPGGALVEGVLRMVPSARVGHIGMFRDEETLQPHVYFAKMPTDIAERDIIIVDPMLATGGSAVEAITEMKKRGCKNIKLMILVAAPEGIRAVQAAHDDVHIYCGAVDEGLNERGYIVPGLGDAGDRIFGTK